MIKMVTGVFGLPVGNGIVERKTKDSEPFKASAEQEARLVKLGLARYVDGPVAEDVVEPIGFDETTDEAEANPIVPLDELTANELRALGKEYGLTFKVGMKKADMVKAIAAAQGAPVEVDETPDEDAPTFDAAEAVL